MAKVWKPGRIVTIGGKKYRVKHNKFRRCSRCPSKSPTISLTAVCAACCAHTGYYEYLEEIKPKSVMG